MGGIMDKTAPIGTLDNKLRGIGGKDGRSFVGEMYRALLDREQETGFSNPNSEALYLYKDGKSVLHKNYLCDDVWGAEHYRIDPELLDLRITHSVYSPEMTTIGLDDESSEASDAEKCEKKGGCSLRLKIILCVLVALAKIALIIYWGVQRYKRG